MRTTWKGLSSPAAFLRPHVPSLPKRIVVLPFVLKDANPTLIVVRPSALMAGSAHTCLPRRVRNSGQTCTWCSHLAGRASWRESFLTLLSQHSTRTRLPRLGAHLIAPCKLPRAARLAHGGADSQGAPPAAGRAVRAPTRARARARARGWAGRLRRWRGGGRLRRA